MRSTPRPTATSTNGCRRNGYPTSSHAGIPDTSEMLYLGGERGWVRKELVKDALGDPVLPQGQKPDPVQAASQ